MFQVKENSLPGTFVAHVTAKDADSTENSRVECTTTNGLGLFQLEPLYGSLPEYKLTTLVTFDREERDVYELVVTCVDQGQPAMTSSSTVQVSISDDNDNSPYFTADVYSVRVLENTDKMALVTSVNATDRDTGDNGRLKYSLHPAPGVAGGEEDKDSLANVSNEGSDSVVSIDAITGTVWTSGPLDYEKQSFHRFIVRATDHGVPPRSGTAVLSIEVVDQSDDEIRFTRLAYHFSVRENSPTSTVIGVVNATLSSDAVDRGRIVYEMFGGKRSLGFEVDRTTGWVRNVRPLDREEVAQYVFSVRAMEENAPMYAVSVNVTVYVEDENDNHPVLVDFNKV